MVHAGPPPERDPRRSNGGPAVLLSTRRQSLGWPALFLSLGLHGLVIAAAALVLHYGQGYEGLDGMDETDAEQASAPIFRSVPKAPSESVHVTPRVTRTFLPATSPRIFAANAHAEVMLPKWEMKPVRPIVAPAPQPAPAESKPAPAPTTNVASKGSSERAQRKAEGKGAGGGRGSELLARKPPQIVSSYAPAYPAAARRAKAEGVTTVKVFVSTKGRVMDCAVYKSAGNISLDDAALRAVKGWKFTPADNDGTEVLVRVTFRLG